MSIHIGNVLSLFDGISCGQIALNRAGVGYNKYFASEIDKHAIKVTQHNYPNTIQLGDVTKVNGAELPKVGLLMGGSPCQGFSFAGKGLNFEDSRSKLFFEYVRLLKETKPKYFLLENVRMKQECQDVISEMLGVEPIAINSRLVSAQNRYRLYWTNIPNVTVPENRGILLRDIIEQDYDGIYVVPRGGNPGGVQSYNGKSPSITTSVWQHNFFICQGAAKRACPRQPTGKPQVKKLEQRLDEKASFLTSHVDDSLVVCEPKGDSNMVGYIRDKKQGNRAYGTEGQSSALLAGSGGIAGSGAFLIKDGNNVRRFTPTECERLQTVPEGYTSCVSDSQRYRSLGNGWTVDVIAHIFKGLS